MKQIVIGDIHGRNYWRDIVKQYFDRVIFIGDYLDTHEDITGVEQLNNFEAICQFKKQQIELGKQVILLIGNHDHHYFPEVGYTGTSGYQNRMKVAFEAAINENRDLLQMCFVDEYKRIYTHAGITKKWCLDNEINYSVSDPKEIETQINELFITRPTRFCYDNRDYSGCGDHICQTPIWVRPQPLYRDKIPFMQIVGHTSIHWMEQLKFERQGFYLIDTLGTSKEYLLIEDEKITILKYE